ncbi:unnamed protein product [Nippostrongylus brasiliensis]|uniref:ATP-dependent DNA helicase n=1 Tax=Nippostrongylus brasiliensis TaxID=27835 RepID=A0A0N4YKQ2_NIPBR|nr:unnamed protein product [Nippostrongylus brasiliensis]
MPHDMSTRARQRRENETDEEREDRLSRQAAYERRRQQDQVEEDQQSQLSQGEERRRGLNEGTEAMDVICSSCQAKHFQAEKMSRHPTVFVQCCDLGRTRLQKFQIYPDSLRQLFEIDTSATGERRRLQINFHQNIRKYNSALAMASMGAHIVPPTGPGPYCFRIHDQIYHSIGPLHPEEGQPRQYGQVYILDTSQAAHERLGIVQNISCDATLMRTLSRLIASINPYAQAFKMMGEVERAEEELARAQHRPPSNLMMVFEESRARGLARRPYDIPTANKVAAVYVAEDDDVPATRSLAVHLRGGALQQISGIDKRCDPLTYPLFFPTGEDGWHVNLKNTKNERLSQMKYYAYLLSIRDDEWNPLLRGGKLLQQFIVDAYVKIEQNRLHYHRTHQKELRLDTFSGPADYVGQENTDITGPPGRRIVLGSSFKGGPRNMQQSYQDAMAIVARHGKPDVFLTITCNPQWREIRENLLPGQSAEHRPDLTTRVFNLKLKELCHDLFKRHIFGEVQAYVMVTEFQKRGLPHCHMLLILKNDFKPRIGTEVDNFCSGEVPSPVEEPELFQAEQKFMVHRRCGVLDPNSPCMKDGRCSKKFPKELRSTTSVQFDGFPHLRRRGHYSVSIDGTEYGDEWIVPYNPYLLLKNNSHINVEICGMITAVKYLNKYVYKGTDKARLRIANNEAVDEIKQYLSARYVCPPEAAHRIFGYDLDDTSPSVVRLGVHLPNLQPVMFQQGEEEAALAQAALRDSTLTAYFKLNERSGRTSEPSSSTAQTLPVDARQLYYSEITQYFTFREKEWKPRGKGGKPTIGRMAYVSPMDTEGYALRILLLNSKGATSFDDVKTVNGFCYEKFLDAAKAAGLLDDDNYFRESLSEASVFQMPSVLRSFFSSLLCYCEISNANALWEEFSEVMAEDFVHRGFSIEQSVVFAYYDVADRMEELGKHLRDFVAAPQQDRPEIPDVPVNFEAHAAEGAALYATLNNGQKHAADNILAAIHRPQNRCFFLDSPGGTGKTYLYNTIYNIAVGRHLKVICVAWTGIAANLLPKGRTVHSAFKLTVGDQGRSSSMKRQQKEAKLLMDTEIIIWDEISMASKAAFEAVDSLLRDLTQDDRPFDGKLIVVGDDFRQTLPIVQHGGREETVQACVTRSSLWLLFEKYQLSTNMRAREAGEDWHEFLLSVGSGDANDADSRVTLPVNLMCETDIVTSVFGAAIEPGNVYSLAELAILAPKNSHVHTINTDALRRLNVLNAQDERTFRSVDDAIVDANVDELRMPTEYLNSLTPSGMPPHELHLKKGAIVMLLRNLDLDNGLCNGTRLMVESLGRFVLGCRFITGQRRGQLTVIPRIDLYWDGAPFRLRRR